MCLTSRRGRMGIDRRMASALLRRWRPRSAARAARTELWPASAARDQPAATAASDVPAGADGERPAAGRWRPRRPRRRSPRSRSLHRRRQPCAPGSAACRLCFASPRRARRTGPGARARRPERRRPRRPGDGKPVAEGVAVWLNDLTTGFRGNGSLRRVGSADRGRHRRLHRRRGGGHRGGDVLGRRRSRRWSAPATEPSAWAPSPRRGREPRALVGGRSERRRAPRLGGRQPGPDPRRRRHAHDRDRRRDVRSRRTLRSAAERVGDRDRRLQRRRRSGRRRRQRRGFLGQHHLCSRRHGAVVSSGAHGRAFAGGRGLRWRRRRRSGRGGERTRSRSSWAAATLPLRDRLVLDADRRAPTALRRRWSRATSTTTAIPTWRSPTESSSTCIGHGRRPVSTGARDAGPPPATTSADAAGRRRSRRRRRDRSAGRQRERRDRRASVDRQRRALARAQRCHRRARRSSAPPATSTATATPTSRSASSAVGRWACSSSSATGAAAFPALTT